MDSLALGKPWYVMEHSTSAVQWKPLNTRKRAGELMRVGAQRLPARQQRFGLVGVAHRQRHGPG